VDAWIRLLRGSAAATRALSADLQREHELTINDYEALLALSRAAEGSLRRVDLADGLLLTASGVTRLLDGLERSGWVTKATCDSDARVTYAVLTEEGRRKLEDASRSHIAAIQELFEQCYSTEELVVLAGLLERLPAASGAQGDACSP